MSTSLPPLLEDERVIIRAIAEQVAEAMIASFEPIVHSSALRIGSTLDPQTHEQLVEALRRTFDSKNQPETVAQGPNETVEEQPQSADPPQHSSQNPQEPYTPSIPEIDDLKD